MKKYLMTVMAAVTLGGLFTGCSKDADMGGGENSAEFNIVQNYEKAFVTRFGQPAETQTWGFGESVAGTRSGNTSGDYTPWPYTHGYEDASGHLIASANMNHNEWADPNKEKGGWLVPDPLTEGQKLRVQKYFQANPNLSYQDPHYANFFVQQVYTGGTSAPATGNKESTKAANGTVHAGSTLNQLTVGAACSHINDFNAGTCTSSNVLDNGQTVNNGTYHSDQITLMVNVDDTSCFGYHETGGSNVKGVINHNDKMALVSAATIDAWAASNGNPGEPVVDKWNRSFLGFDYELLPESDIVPENPTYALLSQVPNINNIQYAWDGTDVMVIGQKPVASNVGGQTAIDLVKFTRDWHNYNRIENGKLVVTLSGWQSFGADFNPAEDWSTYEKLVIEFETPLDNNVKLQLNATNGGEQIISAGTAKYEMDLSESKPTNVSGLYFNAYEGKNINGTISKIYLVGDAPQDNTKYYDTQYLLGDANKIMFYSSSNTNMYGGTIIELTEDQMKTTQDGKTCLNLVKFKELADGGYHPISTDLKKWVKWQAACDGYYSDWIVTLTEAKRIDDGDDDDDDDDDNDGDDDDDDDDNDGDDDDDDDDDDNDNFVCRIIAEDLTVGENSDFDFNDVVFDVINGGTTLRLRAAGGELPLYVAGQEVHAAFATKYSGITQTTLINTGRNGAVDYENYYVDIPSGGAYSSRALAESIPIVVHKNGQDITLKAEKAKVASKIAVGPDFKWCAEREDIDGKFRTKDYTKLFQQYVIGNLGDDWVSGTAWYQLRGK